MSKINSKSIIKSNNIKNGIVEKDMLKITTNIDNAIKGVFEKLGTKANDSVLKISELIDNEEYTKAIELYKKNSFFIKDSQDIFDMLEKINIDKVDNGNKLLVILNKLSIKEHLKDWEYLKQNIPLIIDKYKEELSKNKKLENSLKFQFAYAIQKIGNIETALLMYDDLLKDNTLDYSIEANIYGNKGLLENNIKYIELSADMSLLAGNIFNAVCSKMMLADKIFGNMPQKSLTLIEESENLCKIDNIDDINLKSRIQFSKAFYYMNCGQNELALNTIMGVLKTISSLYGDDINERRYSCYTIGLQLAKNLNNKKIEKEFQSKIDKYKKDIKDESFKQQIHAADAMSLRNFQEMELIKQNNNNNILIQFGTNVSVALYDSSKELSESLELLDEIKRKIDNPEFTYDRKALLYHAYAILFYKNNKIEKAFEYSKLSLNYNPFDYTLRNTYVSNLIKYEKWQDIENFSQKQIDIFGELPNLMYWYAKSIYKQQQSKEKLSKALSILNKYKDEIIEENKSECQKMIADLISNGIEPSKEYIIKSKQQYEILTLDNFDQKIDEFKLYIQQKGRMRFWKNINGKHKFNNSPESIAKNAFMDFFSSEFGKRIKIISEYEVGAGAIDLFIQFSDNLNIIIELKMCGGNYSTNYALEGISQLKHYYENSNSTLCYLIVFDGRKKQGGKIKDNNIQRFEYSNQKYTLKTRAIDIYPKVK